jgi:hypothetical protein
MQAIPGSIGSVSPIRRNILLEFAYLGWCKSFRGYEG